MLQLCSHLEFIIELSYLTVLLDDCSPGIDAFFAADPIYFKSLTEIFKIRDVEKFNIELNLILFLFKIDD